jgi:hypothetical protein
LAEAARISRRSRPSTATRPEWPSGSRDQTQPSRHTDLFPEIIAGVPLLLTPPAGSANQPESERIEGPAPRAQDSSEDRRHGRGKPNGLKQIEVLDTTEL